MTHPIIEFIEARLRDVEVMVKRAEQSFMQGVESSDEEAWLWLADQPGRDVAVKRAILAEHWHDEVAPGLGDPGICGTCYDETADDNAFPCETVRLLASLWGGHPDYEAAWRPGTSGVDT